MEPIHYLVMAPAELELPARRPQVQTAKSVLTVPLQSQQAQTRLNVQSTPYSKWIQKLRGGRKGMRIITRKKFMCVQKIQWYPSYQTEKEVARFSVDGLLICFAKSS